MDLFFNFVSIIMHAVIMFSTRAVRKTNINIHYHRFQNRKLFSTHGTVLYVQWESIHISSVYVYDCVMDLIPPGLHVLFLPRFIKSTYDNFVYYNDTVLVFFLVFFIYFFYNFLFIFESILITKN